MKSFITLIGLAALLSIGAVARHTAAPQPTQTLKPEALKQALENLGYEVKEAKATDDRPIYNFLWTADDGWKYSMSASMSGSGRFAWLVMNLGSTDDAKKVPQEAALALMAENDAIMPMSYSWDAKQMRFFLNCPIDARDFSPQTLRKSIDSMVTSVKRTGDSWDPAHWKKS